MDLTEYSVLKGLPQSLFFYVSLMFSLAVTHLSVSCTCSSLKLSKIAIWSNFMRMHIGLKICHFLQSVVSITEGPKNKIIRKSGIHSSVPCRDSTLEQFLFYRVSRKMLKTISFGAVAIAQYIYQNNTSAIKERPQETQFFSIFLDTQLNKNCFKILSRHGTELWMPDFLIILFSGPSVMLTTDSKK